MVKDINKLINNKTVMDICGLAIRRLFSYLRNKVDKNYEHNKYYYVDTCKDSYDARDWRFSERAGNHRHEYDLPRVVDLYNGEVLDQGRTNHCVAYAAAGGNNENCYFFEPGNEYEYTSGSYIARYIRDNLDRNIDTSGTAISNGPKALRNEGYIEQYLLLGSLYEMKRCLDMGIAIETGTNYVDWRKTGECGVAVQGNGGGHAIHINGYNDDIEVTDVNGKKYKGAFKVKNTWGEDWGPNLGHYRFPYELYDILYNGKYGLYKNFARSLELYDERNSMPYKDVKPTDTFINVFKWAKANNIANGYDDGTLRPKESLNVERMLAFLYNYDKQTNPNFNSGLDETGTKNDDAKVEKK